MAAPTPALGRPVKGLPRYFMDCGWWRHPRFVGLSAEALFTFQAIVSYCTEHTTDGVLPAVGDDLGIALGMRQGWLSDAIPALLEREVIAERREKRGGPVVAYEVRNWAEHNPTAEEVQAYNQAKSRKGTLGNHKRWHESRGVVDPSCEWCRDRSAIPQGIPQGSHGESHGMGWDGSNPPHPPSGDDQETPPEVPDGGAPGGGGNHIGELVDAAIAVMAECDLRRAEAEGAAIRDRDRYRAKLAASRRSAHAETLAALAAEQPGIDPATLAEQVDPTTGHLDGGAARAEAAWRQTQADTEAQLAEQRANAERRRQADAAIAALDERERYALEQRAMDRIAELDPSGAALAPPVVRGVMRDLVLAEREAS